jgi:hypothetical protein
MRRIFGAPQKKEPAPTLEQAGDRLTSRGDRWVLDKPPAAAPLALLHPQHGALHGPAVALPRHAAVACKAAYRIFPLHASPSKPHVSLVSVQT